MKQCENCHANFEGLYCPQCGQKIFNRFDFRYVIEELQNLLELDKGVFNNFKNLFFQPGKIINDYLYGKTKPYYPPLPYFLLSMTFFILLAIHSFDISDWSVGKVFILDTFENTKGLINYYQKERKDVYQKINFENLKQKVLELEAIENTEKLSLEDLEKKAFRTQAIIYTVFYLTPFYFAIIFYFFHFRGLHNFTEHLIVHLFLSAQIFWYINGIAMFIYLINWLGFTFYFNSNTLIGIYLFFLLLLAFYYCVAIKKTYQQNWFWSIVKVMTSIIIIFPSVFISILLIGYWITGKAW